MKFVSIFNDVLGPVMRGPSSSHTAGSYRIGKIARSLLGEIPSKVSFTFDPNGSYSKTYRQQGVDLGFAAGLMEWDITDSRFLNALDYAAESGIGLEFLVKPIENADHPNTVVIRMTSVSGKGLYAIAKSTGGGGIQFTQLENWIINIDGKKDHLFLETTRNNEQLIEGLLSSDQILNEPDERIIDGNDLLLVYSSDDPLPEDISRFTKKYKEISRGWYSSSVFYQKRGKEIFNKASEIVDLFENKDCSLGQAALEYECSLLGLTEEEALKEMVYRYGIMHGSVRQGLKDENVNMQLLGPTAGKVNSSIDSAYIGGIHTRAAAMAMASLHISNSMGIVCAAPTGGSAGVIPGVLSALEEEKKLKQEDLAMALFAAGAVGLIVAKRATFAAEVAGCQVEIGAAGAMASAAVVDLAGGTAREALDAAAISLQNTLGSVCDLVQGICEIPCHTRNAAAASNAFVCADLILGGYVNPIGLDETVDASYASGKMLPSELRCTALGGLADTPSAKAMNRLK